MACRDLVRRRGNRVNMISEARARRVVFQAGVAMACVKPPDDHDTVAWSHALPLVTLWLWTGRQKAIRWSTKGGDERSTCVCHSSPRRVLETPRRSRSH